MATHSSVLAWRIPGTGEPGGLLSMGSQRVGHDGSDLAAVAAAASQPSSPTTEILLSFLDSPKAIRKRQVNFFFFSFFFNLNLFILIGGFHYFSPQTLPLQEHTIHPEIQKT